MEGVRLDPSHSSDLCVLVRAQSPNDHHWRDRDCLLTTVADDDRGEHVDQFLIHHPRSTSTKTSKVKQCSCPLLAFFFPQGFFLALWVCTEDRLGRVGTMKWFSWLAVLLLLIMAATIDTTALFLSVCILTYFITGERRACGFCCAVLCLQV